jgi:hypothetical protein
VNLRALAIGIGGLAVAAAVALVVHLPRAWPVSADVGLFGLLLITSTLFERRYRRNVTATPAGFEPTGERFVDPTSGAIVTVDYDPATGERRYRS